METDDHLDSYLTGTVQNGTPTPGSGNLPSQEATLEQGTVLDNVSTDDDYEQLIPLKDDVTLQPDGKDSLAAAADMEPAPNGDHFYVSSSPAVEQSESKSKAYMNNDPGQSSIAGDSSLLVGEDIEDEMDPGEDIVLNNFENEQSKQSNEVETNTPKNTEADISDEFNERTAKILTPQNNGGQTKVDTDVKESEHIESLENSSPLAALGSDEIDKEKNAKDDDSEKTITEHDINCIGDKAKEELANLGEMENLSETKEDNMETDSCLESDASELVETKNASMDVDLDTTQEDTSLLNDTLEEEVSPRRLSRGHYTPGRRGRPPKNRARRKGRPSLHAHTSYVKPVTDQDSPSTKPVSAPKTPSLTPILEALYTAPFQEGWRREVVFRGVYSEVTKMGTKKNPPADVYYHPPHGSKIRSMVQVADWLENHQTNLTVENFSFMRKPIWKSPGETIRSASHSRGRGQKRPQVVIERDTDDNDSFSPISASNYIMKTYSPTKLSFKRSLPIKKELVKVKEDKAVCKEEVVVKHTNQSVQVSPPRKKFKPTARKSTTQKSFQEVAKEPRFDTELLKNLCTLRCPGLSGIDPSLHCEICMCLFHPECVNFKASRDRKFKCQRCIKVPGMAATNGVLIASMPSAETLVSQLMSPPLNASTGSSSESSVLRTTMSSPTTTVMYIKPSSTSTLTIASSANGKTTNADSSHGLIKIKSEPVDNGDYGGKLWHDQVKVGEVHTQTFSRTQASQMALGSLKSVLDKKNTVSQISSVSSSLMPVSCFPPPVSMAATGLTPRMLFKTNPLMNASMSSSLPAEMLRFPPITMTSLPGNVRLIPVGPVIRNPSINFGLPVSSPVSPSFSAPIASPSRPLPNNLLTMPVGPLTTVVTSGSIVSVAPASSKTTPVLHCASIEESQNRTGQMLTLPQAVTKRLCLTKPLALKINNMQVIVPPSGFISKSDGLKVFLPPSTFPASYSGNVCVTVSNQKDDSLPDPVTKELGQLELPKLKEKSSPSVGSEQSRVKYSGNVNSSSKSRPNLRSSRSCFIQKLYGGFDCMEHIFQYLNLRDLCSVGKVCRSWRRVTQHPCLWQEVSFHDMKVPSWITALKFLSKKKVEALVLYSLDHDNNANKTWHQLISALPLLESLKRIYFGLVPALVLHNVCEKLSQIEVIIAECISDFTDDMMWEKPTKLDIGKFALLTNLRDLRLKGVGGLCLPAFCLMGSMQDLAKLYHLKVLCLTSLKNMSDSDFQFLSSMPQLEELGLGECNCWTSETYFRLSQLKNLRRLRLEQGGELQDSNLYHVLPELINLVKLELYLYTVSENLGEALKKVPKLKTLIIWPDNSTQPPTVNSYTLDAVKNLTQLKKLDWVIPNTSSGSIILDNDGGDRPSDDRGGQSKQLQQWIPFLPERQDEDNEGGMAISQYLSVKQITEKLVKCLPTTQIKVTLLLQDRTTPSRLS